MDLSTILVGSIILALIINLAVEIEKKIFTSFPVNIMTTVTSIIATILAFIAYMSAAEIPFTISYGIYGIAACIIEAYIAMFGYDKFIQTVKQYKEYADETKEKTQLK